MTRTRTLVTTLAATTGVAGLLGAFVLGATLGGSPDDDRDRRSGPPVGGRLGGTDAVVAAYAGTDLAPAASCTDLLDWYVERGVDLVGPWGWGGGPVYEESMGSVPVAPQGSDDMASGSEAADSAAAPAPTRQTNEPSGTNVQEAGVDEPDSVKTDGTTLWRVDGNDLTAYDVSGAEVERVGSVDLPQMDDAEILLAGGTAVAIAADVSAEEPVTRIAVVDVSDPTRPSVEHTHLYDTALVTARLHGETVRLVVQAGLPDLDFVEPGARTWGIFGGGEDTARRKNEEIVRSTTFDDWLPHVSTDGGEPELLLGCDEVGLPDDESGLGTIAIVGFDLDADDPDGAAGTDAADAADASVTGLAVSTDVAYASTDRLYLATSARTGGGWSDCFDCRASTTLIPPGDDGTSRLYSFTLAGRDTTYAASGEVDGTLADRWSIDEADGVLRVAVGASSRTDAANSIVTLTEDGDDLVEVGRIDGLGPDESIQSMRWFDDLALMVTFRETDPLYAIDLTDPAAPQLLGELKIPGFSAYLHPLGSDRLIGLGEGPDDTGRSGWGAQMGLFDVTDLTDPRRIALTHYGSSTYAPATSDPRQFTWLPDSRTVLTVIADYGRNETGYVSVVRLGDGAMVNEMVEVEHGSEIAAVRLVPLPDGRVVLVTGDGASFFDLA